MSERRQRHRDETRAEPPVRRKTCHDQPRRPRVQRRAQRVQRPVRRIRRLGHDRQRVRLTEHGDRIAATNTTGPSAVPIAANARRKRVSAGCSNRARPVASTSAHAPSSGRNPAASPASNGANRNGSTASVASAVTKPVSIPAPAHAASGGQLAKASAVVPSASRPELPQPRDRAAPPPRASSTRRAISRTPAPRPAPSRRPVPAGTQTRGCDRIDHRPARVEAIAVPGRELMGDPGGDQRVVHREPEQPEQRQRRAHDPDARAPEFLRKALHPRVCGL